MKKLFSVVINFFSLRFHEGFGEKGNIGKISKGKREHEPIFRKQGNKTLQIRERKHGKQIY